MERGTLPSTHKELNCKFTASFVPHTSRKHFGWGFSQTYVQHTSSSIICTDNSAIQWPGNNGNCNYLIACHPSFTNIYNYGFRRSNIMSGITMHLKHVLSFAVWFLRLNNGNKVYVLPILMVTVSEVTVTNVDWIHSTIMKTESWTWVYTSWLNDDRDLSFYYENQNSKLQPSMLAITILLSMFLSVVASTDLL